MIYSDFHLNKSWFDKPLDFDCISLIQIGRMFCKSTTVIDSHIHADLYELTIVTDGKAMIYTNNIATSVKKGDIYLSLPGDIHKIESNINSPLKYDFFAFRINNTNFKREFETISREYAMPATRVFEDKQIGLLVSNIITELEFEDKYASELLDSVFKQILIYVIRGFKRIKPKNNHTNLSQNELLCFKLMNYIDTHVYYIKNLNELCEVAGLSYGYLSTIFKKTTHSSLSEYYRTKKLDSARFLLQEQKLSITEISELLNYTSVYAFSKAFKNHYGLSPKKFRLTS